MVVGPFGSARCQNARLCVLIGGCIRNSQSAGISCGGVLLNRTTNALCSLRKLRSATSHFVKRYAKFRYKRFYYRRFKQCVSTILFAVKLQLQFES